jgi:hypothetical protein
MPIKIFAGRVQCSSPQCPKKEIVAGREIRGLLEEDEIFRIDAIKHEIYCDSCYDQISNKFSFGCMMAKTEQLSNIVLASIKEKKTIEINIPEKKAKLFEVLNIPKKSKVAIQ